MHWFPAVTLKIKIKNMLRKLSLILVLLGTIYPSLVKCQDTLKNYTKSLDIALSVNVSATKFYNADFISSLKQHNLPAAMDNALLGFNGDIYLSSLNPDTRLIAVIGVGFVSQKKTNSNITLNATEMSNDYNIDYVVWKHKRQYFYPGIGFGWLEYNYSLIDKVDAPSSYPESLQNFTGERNIQSNNLTYLNFTANYDWAIDNSNDYLLGVRVAYHLGLNHKNLQLSDGYELNQSPELKASAVSIGVAFTVQ